MAKRIGASPDWLTPVPLLLRLWTVIWVPTEVSQIKSQTREALRFSVLHRLAGRAAVKMRTRRSTRQEEQPSGPQSQPPIIQSSAPTAPQVSGDHRSPSGGGTNGGGTLSDISMESVSRLLKRAGTRKGKGKGRPVANIAEAGELMIGSGKGKTKEELIQDVNLQRCSFTNADRSTLSKDGARGTEYGGSSKCDANDFDWEEGSIPVSEDREGYSHDLGREVIIEFTDSPCSAQRKPSRRASAEEKELAELMHRVHLLCLLARGRLVDSVCNDRLIQASLLSLLPPYLLKVADTPRLTAKMLGSLVKWFGDNFRIQSQRIDRGSFKSNLSFALESREGTIEEIAALSVVLFRALNIMTRFVSILDVVSRKPDSDLCGGSNQNTPHLDTKISSLGYNVVSPNPFPSASGMTDKDMISETPQIGNHLKRKINPTCKKKLLNDSVGSCQSDDGSSCASGSKGCIDKIDPCDTLHTEAAKRKGDAEFELQMQMALSATGAVINDNEVVSHNTSVAPPTKKMRIMNTEESSVSTYRRTGAVWSRKVGPPMFWAEVYCSGETLNGRWVHIDAANAIIDGEDKVESSVAAWKKPLKYVVAFAGNGAKDVTRRYCMHWYKISPQRVSSQWWDSVLAPLKKLEADASSKTFDLDAIRESNSTGMEATMSEGSTPTEVDFRDLTESSSKEFPDHANLSGGLNIGSLNQLNNPIDLKPQVQHPAVSSLEDMELETRALTEPLPTNQQAYKNHHLYAIERWLTKNQTLNPRGPVLGYCSGHPVFPRSCVQILQTKHKWLREGLQVRANEVPAKVVKRSKKSGILQLPESDISEEGDNGAAIELYGKWQLEMLQLPHAVNGIVPKNERGQVEVWSEKCLPPGTVHLRFPRIGQVARRLEIDYAPAMVGFEFRSGRSFPIFEGIVVCTEFKDAILEAYLEVEERREAEEKKRHEYEALSRWFQLLSSIVTRQRLENSYGGCSVSASINHSDQMNVGPSEILRSSREDITRRGVQVEDGKSVGQSTCDHEHTFPMEDQSFDEENFIRTKRCPCGFSIQVEEL